MDPITQQIALASAGAAAGDPVYVDDVFSTFLYEGNDGSNRSINNGIDLSGEGGCVWLKHREGQYNGIIVQDTERFVSSSDSNQLDTSSTGGQTDYNGFTSFNSNGFSVTDFAGDLYNASGENYVSWSFRKAPGFFDVVTWTGNSSTNRTVSHNLGSVPGAIIIKQTNSSGNNWCVYHRSTGTSKALSLNLFGKAENRDDRVKAVSSSTFTLGNSSEVNFNGSTYVAYVFAHDDQSFGTDQNESIIKCGSYTGNGNFSGGGPEVDLGFEPQWIMIKNATESGTYSNWHIYDNSRGVSSKSDDIPLSANRAAAEGSTFNTINNYISFNSRGFKIQGPGYTVTDTQGETYIYIAIRRSHKPPTAGSEVFDVKDRGFSNHSGNLVNTSTIGPIDLAITKLYDGQSGYSNYPAVWSSRKTGYYSHRPNENTAAVTNIHGTNYYADRMWGYQDAVLYAQTTEISSYSYGRKYVDYFFKRAAGFFDIVVYKGTGSATTVPHNLGVKPELIIAKNMDSGLYSWRVYSEPTDATDYLTLNSDSTRSDLNTIWNDTEPTSSVFSVGTNGGTNGSGNDIIAYLFASLDGISKVGSYTGNSSYKNIDCGFANGARFVMIKRVDGPGGDWYVWDSDRGIVSGIDPYFFMNGDVIHNDEYDYIDPHNDGFSITSSAPSAVNGLGGTFLFLAIA